MKFVEPKVVHRCRKRRFRQKCAEAFGVPEQRIIGPRRYAPIVRARHAVAYGLFHKFNLSFTEIGELLGGMHQVSVAYAVRRFGVRVQQDPEIAKIMRRLRVKHTDRVPLRGKPV